MAARNTTKDQTKNHLRPFLNDRDLQTRKPRPERYEISYAPDTALRVRIQPSGTKTFVWRVQHEGRRKVVVLGKYGTAPGDLTIAKAHVKLGDLKQRNNDGVLFTGAETTPRTVKALAEQFYKDRILPHRKRPEIVRYVLEKDVLPIIGNRKPESVSVVDVTNLIRKVVNRGAAGHAGKVLATVKQLFRYAESCGYVERSPAYSHDPKSLGVKTNVRNRTLDAEEIRAFWKALDKAPQMSDPLRVGLRILLLSGVRSGELLLAEWSHIDFEKGEWLIPEENSKTREWTVPLSSHLIKLFRQLQDYAGDSRWVLPGKTEEDRPITDKALNRAMRRLFEVKVEGKSVLDIKWTTPHDLRRTFRSHADNLGIEPHIAEKCLNHSLGRIAETYNTNQMLPQRREALEKWGDFISVLVRDSEKVRRLADVSR